MFYVSSLPGEMIQFDYIIFFVKWVGNQPPSRFFGWEWIWVEGEIPVFDYKQNIQVGVSGIAGD